MHRTATFVVLKTDIINQKVRSTATFNVAELQSILVHRTATFVVLKTDIINQKVRSTAIFNVAELQSILVHRTFIHSNSQIDRVVKYILNQDKHHKKRSFREEYLEILRKNDIEFDEQYLFEFFD